MSPLMKTLKEVVEQTCLSITQACPIHDHFGNRAGVMIQNAQGGPAANGIFDGECVERPYERTITRPIEIKSFLLWCCSEQNPEARRNHIIYLYQSRFEDFQDFSLLVKSKGSWVGSGVHPVSSKKTCSSILYPIKAKNMLVHTLSKQQETSIVMTIKYHFLMLSCPSLSASSFDSDCDFAPVASHGNGPISG